MAKAWADVGNSATELTVPDVDHFSILNELCREDGMLRRAIATFERRLGQDWATAAADQF
jgi:hypothetical protein